MSIEALVHEPNELDQLDVLELTKPLELYYEVCLPQVLTEVKSKFQKLLNRRTRIKIK